MTLVELLIVIALLGVLVGLAVTNYQPGLTDQLRGAAQVVVADLAYARSLAVSHNSRYRVQFQAPGQLYWLEHSGTNSQLDRLPRSPSGRSDDTPQRQTTDLSRLPLLHQTVELDAVQQLVLGVPYATDGLEFGPLGALTHAKPVVIWLAAGGGTARRYLPVEVEPVTGLVRIGEMQASRPASAAPVALPAQNPAAPPDLLPGSDPQLIFD